MQSDNDDIHARFIEFAQNVYEETGVVIDRVTFYWERVETMTAPPRTKIRSVSIDSTKEQ